MIKKSSNDNCVKQTSYWSMLEKTHLRYQTYTMYNIVYHTLPRELDYNV